MKTNADRVIVLTGECPWHSILSTLVHHRDFPEIWAEGRTIEEGATQLALHLERALEGARSAWHRQAMEQAMADVNEYLSALRSAPVAETNPTFRKTRGAMPDYSSIESSSGPLSPANRSRRTRSPVHSERRTEPV